MELIYHKIFSYIAFGAGIALVFLIHEVGHHFGLSDEDMHALEDSVGADSAEGA